MDRESIDNEYFNWLYGLMVKYRPHSYRKLFSKLHDMVYCYTIVMDGNRAADGENLRYRFADDRGYPHSKISVYLDNKPCSVLEMLVALSIRCEEHIMGDLYGNDILDRWFWVMLENISLDRMYDAVYNEYVVEDNVNRFMSHDYNFDGSDGGLFIVHNPRRDMRETEIWFQLNWYLSELRRNNREDT